jgi:outer membrane receptor for Fe3+-dicitrate
MAANASPDPFGAYTYSHFTYSSYQSLAYPGNLTGNFLPNSPNHQLYADAKFEFPHDSSLLLSTLTFSRAFVDPTNAAWTDGYTLLGARLSKGWRYQRTEGSFFVAGRNLTGKKYIAFSEPDPDGNSYHPGPRREVFVGTEIRF